MSWNSCVIKERDRKEDEGISPSKLQGGFLLFDNLLKKQTKKILKAIPHHLFNYSHLKIPNIPKKPEGLA